MDDLGETADLGVYVSASNQGPNVAVKSAAITDAVLIRLRRALIVRRCLLAVVFGIEVALVSRFGRVPDAGQATFRDRLFVVMLMSASLSWVAVGVVLCDRQPRNRCGRLMVAVGFVVVSAWIGLLAISGSADPPRAGIFVYSACVAAVRPVLVWLLLSWPTGRLTRGVAWFVGGYGAFLMVWGLVGAIGINEAVIEDISLIRRMDVIVDLFVGFGGLVIVLVLLVRRQHRLPANAQSLLRPIVAATAVAVVADLLFSLGNNFVPEARSRFLFAFIFDDVYFIGFVLVALVLMLTAWRRRTGADQPATVDLGRATMTRPVSAIVAECLDDVSARVLFPDDGGWVDAAGAAAGMTLPGRHRSVIERDGVVIAAIDHDEAVAARPASLEAAAGSLALFVEHDALEARTRFQLRELDQLRLAILDAEDSARRLLERDLHDGTQQQLLALALQARAERLGPTSRCELADKILATRDELLRVAGGLTERVVAERGLDRTLRALVATAPFTVGFSSKLLEVVPSRMAAAAWFVASEGLANAVKHAHAQNVTIDVRSSCGQLQVIVRDDGCGLADIAGSGLRGLARRMRELGGDLLVQSAPGSGTSLVASLPLGGVA